MTGGHAECVTLLMGASCDTELACDTGLTGWQLAAQLKRTQVLALMPPTGGGCAGSESANVHAHRDNSSRASVAKFGGRRTQRKQRRQGVKGKDVDTAITPLVRGGDATQTIVM
jgi:hypothetical protein